MATYGVVRPSAAGAAAGGGRGIGRDVERDEEFAEEEPGAARLVDEAGVLADPAEAGQAGVGALEQRRGIDADSGFEGAGATAQQRVELLEAAAEFAVIIGAPGVAGDPGARGLAELGGGGPGGVVELAGADDGAGGGEQLAGIVADLGAVIGQVAHFAGVTGSAAATPASSKPHSRARERMSSAVKSQAPRSA